MHPCMHARQCASDSTCKQGPWCTDAVRGGVQQTCSSKVTQDCEGASSSPSHLLPLRSQILHCRSCSRGTDGVAMQASAYNHRHV